jgi:hypothetical protein
VALCRRRAVAVGVCASLRAAAGRDVARLGRHRRRGGGGACGAPQRAGDAHRAAHPGRAERLPACAATGARARLCCARRRRRRRRRVCRDRRRRRERRGRGRSDRPGRRRRRRGARGAREGGGDDAAGGEQRRRAAERVAGPGGAVSRARHADRDRLAPVRQHGQAGDARDARRRRAVLLCVCALAGRQVAVGAAQRELSRTGAPRQGGAGADDADCRLVGARAARRRPAGRRGVCRLRRAGAEALVAADARCDRPARVAAGAPAGADGARVGRRFDQRVRAGRPARALHAGPDAARLCDRARRGRGDCVARPAAADALQHAVRADRQRHAAAAAVGVRGDRRRRVWRRADRRHAGLLDPAAALAAAALVRRHRGADAAGVCRRRAAAGAGRVARAVGPAAAHRQPDAVAAV